MLNISMQPHSQQFNVAINLSQGVHATTMEENPLHTDFVDT